MKIKWSVEYTSGINHHEEVDVDSHEYQAIVEALKNAVEFFALRSENHKLRMDKIFGDRP